MDQFGFDEIYKQAFDSYGPSPQALHWVNYESQAIRFKQLVADIDIEGKHILDAGCGLGDLLPFLYSKADVFDYLGVDANKSFITEAGKRYAGHKFRIGDALTKKVDGDFDVIFTSGTLNHNTPNWLKWRQQAIKNLFGQTHEALAFNMAGGLNPVASDNKIAYAPSQEILEFCLELTDKVIFKNNYNPRDFTIVMFK